MLITFDQKFAPVLEAFCKGPKVEVALINAVQVYCYDDTRFMKTFTPILKVFPSLLCTFTRIKILRSCITKIVSLTKLSFIGTRKAPNLKVDSTLSRPLRHLSRY